jgi:hypothetical protein
LYRKKPIKCTNKTQKQYGESTQTAQTKHKNGTEKHNCSEKNPAQTKHNYHNKGQNVHRQSIAIVHTLDQNSTHMYRERGYRQKGYDDIFYALHQLSSPNSHS